MLCILKKEVNSCSFNCGIFDGDVCGSVSCSYNVCTEEENGKCVSCISESEDESCYYSCESKSVQYSCYYYKIPTCSSTSKNSYVYTTYLSYPSAGPCMGAGNYGMSSSNLYYECDSVTGEICEGYGYCDCDCPLCPVDEC